jgi:hypothetical protein
MEDAADDLRLNKIDPPLAGLDRPVGQGFAYHIISIRVAAARAAGLDATRKPRRVLSARSFRNSAFMVPFSPTCSSPISPSDSHVRLGANGDIREPQPRPL